MQRKLAVILAADVAGYSRMMAENEEATRATMMAYRATLGEIVAEHGGRIFNTAGDSAACEFASPVQAVRAAVAIQRALAVVSTRRSVCLAPLADAAAMPDGPRTPVRLVVVTGTARAPVDQHLAFSDFIAAERAGRSVWVPEILRIYQVASQSNPLLCRSLFAQLGDRPVGACGR